MPASEVYVCGLMESGESVKSSIRIWTSPCVSIEPESSRVSTETLLWVSRNDFILMTVGYDQEGSGGVCNAVLLPQRRGQLMLRLRLRVSLVGRRESLL